MLTPDQPSLRAVLARGNVEQVYTILYSSTNLLGSHKVDILVEGTQIPSTLLYTIEDAMQCITGKQILVKVRCYGEQEGQQGQ
jgi:hypothetical protein